MYCPELQCVFVHVPRTAGTSITMALAPYCPDVVWKPDGAPDPDHSSFARQCARYGLAPSSVLSFAFVRNPWERYVSFYDLYRRMRRDMSAEELMEAEQLDTGLLYAELPFARWFELCFDPDTSESLTRPISRWIDSIDFLGQYEKLDESFEVLCVLLGLPELTLPRSNARRVPTVPYVELFTPALRDLVAEYERPVIERFGYAFTGSQQ